MGVGVVSNNATSNNATTATDVLAVPNLLTPPFFDVDPAATLVLRNVSMNVDCDTLVALQTGLCKSMPDPRFEVALWSVRVASLVAPGLVVDNVTLRCGPSASNATTTVTFLGNNNGDSNQQKVANDTMTDRGAFPCVAVRVSNTLELVSTWASTINAQPRAVYMMLIANLTSIESYARSKYTPVYRIRIFITGLRDVPTQLDLCSLVSILALQNAVGPDPSLPSTVEFRDLYLTNLEYGSPWQYPIALVTAALWFLDYRRADYSLVYNDVPVQVNMTRVTFVVSDVELRWWRGLVGAALAANATGVDPSRLIRVFEPGLRVAPVDGSIWVPYWEWAYGMMSWSNCTLTASPLLPVPRPALATRSDLLDTLAPAGQTGPVPLSAVRLASPELDGALLTSNGSTVMLPADTQLSSGLVGSRAVLGANLTIWGDAQGVRALSLNGLSGVLTVPPDRVLTLRFVNLINLGVGPRDADPAPLQNYTLMMWAFNRTLAPAPAAPPPAAPTARRAALSVAGGLAGEAGRAGGGDASAPPGGGATARRAGALPSAGWLRLGALHPHLLLGAARSPSSAVEHEDAAPVECGTRGAGGPSAGGGGCGLAVSDAAAGGLWQGRRRRHAQSSAAGGGSSGSDTTTTTITTSSIPVGPFRPWLRLENVYLFPPALEVQLMYDLMKDNRTALRVAPAAVDFFRRVLATAVLMPSASSLTSSMIQFSSLRWLGIEAINLSVDGRSLSGTKLPLLSPSASILLPVSPPPPPPSPPSPPPAVQRASPPPSLAPQQPPANTVPASPPPPLPPPSGGVQAAPEAAPAAAPAVATPIGSIVGPAVGSAAGLLLLCGLVAFIMVYVRNRRRRAARAAAAAAAGAKGGEEDKGAEGGASGGDGDGGAPSARLSSNCRSPGAAGSGQPPPPPPSSSAQAKGAAQAVPAGADVGGEIQPATDDSVKRTADGAAAAGGSGAGGNGRPGSGLPPRSLNKPRSRDATGSGSGGRRQQGGVRQSGTGDGPGGGGNSGPGGSSSGRQQQRSRKSRSSGSAASAASGSKSGAGSSGATSETTASMNPRTELYAALAAFQSELGEQQQITILSQLGAGAHGVVYRGEWRGLEVAVKTLLFQAFVGGAMEDSGNSLKEQAMLEAAIATTLYHPNVINTFSYDIKPLRMCPAPASSSASSRADTVASSEGGSIMDWKLYIIQEYCDGGTLKDALDGARFTDPDTGMAFRETAVRVAIEIASGMSYIHARNIIHGDLKPANILLRSNGASPYGYTAKIADFGLALKLKAGESHISNIRRGTPFYIACELVEDGRATTASDLYSFGVILWELLHGSTVARRLPLRRRIPNLPAEFYTWPPDAPPAYRDLASACLSSNPAARPRFSEALSVLLKLLNGLVEARKAEQQRRQQQQEARRRLAAEASARVDSLQEEARGQGQDHGQHRGQDLRGEDQGGGEPAIAEAEADGGGANGGGAAAQSSSSEMFWTPPMLLGNVLLKSSAGGKKNSAGGAAAVWPGGAVGTSNGSAAWGCGSARKTGDGEGGAAPEAGDDGPAGPGRSLEATVAATATASTATGEYGNPSTAAAVCVGGTAALVRGSGSKAFVRVPLKPTPEDAELPPSFEPSPGQAVPGRTHPVGADPQPSAPAEAAGLAGAGPGAAAAAGLAPGQPPAYAPFGGARPTSLRALVRTTSATAAEAQAATASTLADVTLPTGGAGRTGFDETNALTLADRPAKEGPTAVTAAAAIAP